MDRGCRVVGAAWFIIDGIGAWVAGGEGLTPEEMTGAVELGREEFVRVEVLFDTIEINMDDQYPTCLAA